MEMLKQEILTPSTAKFPPNDEIKLEREKGDSTFRVSSHVDAQNAFGAMIRQNWEIHLWYIGGAFSDSLSWRKLYE